MTFRRLGGTRDLKVDLRVIAATNKDLAAEVKRGTFRLDLYHRLDVFHLRLPPLRDRRDDILPLARKFVSMFALRMKKPKLSLARETERILTAYDYPGNVRELKNLIERAVILSSGETIGERASSCPALRATGWSPTISFPLSSMNQDNADPRSSGSSYITKLLAFAQGNRTQVARLLGVPIRQSQRKSRTTASQRQGLTRSEHENCPASAACGRVAPESANVQRRFATKTHTRPKERARRGTNRHQCREPSSRNREDRPERLCPNRMMALGIGGDWFLDAPSP